MKKDVDWAGVPLAEIRHVYEAVLEHFRVSVPEWFLVKHMQLPVVEVVFVRWINFFVFVSGHVLKQELQITAGQIVTTIYHTLRGTRLARIQLMNC